VCSIYFLAALPLFITMYFLKWRIKTTGTSQHKDSKFLLPNVLLTIGLVISTTLLVGCGGSSSSDNAVSDQAENQGDTSSTDTSTPDTSGNTDTTNNNATYDLGNTSQSVVDQCMSDVDKEMLTLVNNNRATAQSCGSQNFPATTSLSWHCTLDNVADGHNRDMGDHNFFNHIGSDGLNPSQRITNAGYNWSSVGENIAAGQQTVQSVMTAWMDSPGHCENIMNPVYTEMGAASYVVTGADFSIYWTQNFARP
jgi:uncharacterized protein YkwD